MTEINAAFGVEDDVARIEIRREAKLNAVDMETKRAITDRLGEYRDRDDVQVVLFESAGNDAFCAGGDLQEVKEREYALEPFTETWEDLFTEMRTMPQPTVAKIDGHTYGGGFDLLLHTDIPIAADDAQIGQPESTLGVVNHFSPPELVHRVGLPTTMDLLMTGEAISGERADEIGLVARSVPADALDATVESALDALTAKSPRVLKKLKRSVYASAEMSPTAAKSHVEAISLEAARTDPDYREGVDAQLERRDPDWS
ncbi:enoyl-CoA hydratase/isomerase family protein [Haladaptatus caseinilyticus]|uniref:enoyl-CoA hydratase/isomerase family protein n=1 Tax=Haladaptatus caseinilyticus TaxID=2993314 RepID=UPI00224B7C53|nr:enoyl-CoA hydratase/isomerase family protein [Haladaptatus caseinilyticus]